MPFASSWKARDSIGGGMESTCVLRLSTTSCWIHWKTNSTLASLNLSVLML
eukprot:CAMPEP_0171129400 /NCGR_PEP_ID=MMETSP0766_2-20121228/118892_1 /TAXON_ID=439317 /ORGANISM="Gambierdiscus australes, Strain CAWD 149" /LENGTH=50 /DNA_ID=CAMNT_0011592597 /DNA_START=107 /DNA_END=255 /DNA_ORIENTATION=+